MINPVSAAPKVVTDPPLTAILAVKAHSAASTQSMLVNSSVAILCLLSNSGRCVRFCFASALPPRKCHVMAWGKVSKQQRLFRAGQLLQTG
jgi:hypothetical protein